jgi:hypothetical protein
MINVEVDEPRLTKWTYLISFHVYANNTTTSIEEAFITHLTGKTTAMDNKIPLAPVENK